MRVLTKHVYKLPSPKQRLIKTTTQESKGLGNDINRL